MWEYQEKSVDNKLDGLEKASIPHACKSTESDKGRAECGSNDVGQEKAAAVGFSREKETVSGLDWAEGNREKGTLGPSKEKTKGCW